ncbi:MAG: hypothetical protein GF334_08280 [Candidatus Altiarchaeales archaeon]|nr:hypothetical protein [Candidatus Altiarchaeales archaeon]
MTSTAHRMIAITYTKMDSGCQTQVCTVCGTRDPNDYGNTLTRSGNGRRSTDPATSWKKWSTETDLFYMEWGIFR